MRDNAAPALQLRIYSANERNGNIYEVAGLTAPHYLSTAMHDSLPYRDRGRALRRVFETESFMEDARDVIKTPAEEFDQALHAVSVSSGFLDGSGLAGTLEIIADGDQRRAVRNFISAFSNWRASAAQATDRQRLFKGIVEVLQETVTQGSPALSNEEWLTLSARVSAIWDRPFPAVDLAIKAARLTTDVGTQLDRMTLVCDLRPVFDESRSTVQGLIPLTTLKIVSHREDDMRPDTFEVQLTERELEELHEKVTFARTKISALKNFVAKAGVALPASSMTKAAQEET